MIKKTNFLYYVTGITIISVFIFVVYVLAFHEIPEKNKELFIHLLGIVEGAFLSGLVATFFGSSKRDHDPGVVSETETQSITKQS